MVSGKPLYMTDSEQRSTHAQRNAAIRDASQRSAAAGFSGLCTIQRNTDMRDASTHTHFFRTIASACDYVTP